MSCPECRSDAKFIGDRSCRPTCLFGEIVYERAYAGGILSCPRVALETLRKNQLEPDISKWLCHNSPSQP